MRLFHRHRWKTVDVEYARLIYDRDFSAGEEDITLVKSVCEICGKPRTQQVTGSWTLEQLAGEASGEAG